MIALEWRDVDLGKRQICVQRSDWNGQVTTPKGGRLRYVPLTIRLATAFRDHRHLRSPNVLCGTRSPGLAIGGFPCHLSGELGVLFLRLDSTGEGLRRKDQ
jgi:integrase